MEITSQLANIEDEIKLLKGEIKSILKEIRAAVLNSDNPFANPTSAQQLAAVTSAPAEPTPKPTPEESAPFAPRPVEVHSTEAARVPADSPFGGPVPIRTDAAAAVEALEGRRTNLLTIAALLSWAEDAIAALGARRFRFMLELAFFADLLSPEIRDVLRDASEAWAKDTDSDRPVNVNECLLYLRQLEAIVDGERVERIPRRRARKRGA